MSDPFAEPKGWLGALAGRMMARGNANQQRELLDYARLRGDERVLEVGYGPGVLAALALERHPGLSYDGVDPSEVMQKQASARAPRARFHIGKADALAFDDDSFDVVFSVNNVRIWADVDTSARALRRVLAPGGRLFVSWHSRRSRSLTQRNLGMQPDAIDALRAQLANAFPTVEAVELPSSDVFVAASG